MLSFFSTEIESVGHTSTLAEFKAESILDKVWWFDSILQSFSLVSEIRADVRSVFWSVVLLETWVFAELSWMDLWKLGVL